ncbi:MAG: manganese efflux pump MntP family protein [Helicobacter sp.]|nr:manganese efflux pump MntP family protein [Helicobacter sp.]
MIAAYLEIIILGISLAIDACIVAFSYGLCSKPWKINNGLRIAITTSFFQWLMPIIGWYMLWIANEGFSDYASIVDHWITFAIFLVLGLKIIKDAHSEEDEDQTPKTLSLGVLLLIGIATSIDALAAGVMIFSQNTPLYMSASLIGAITFVCVIIAYVASKTLSQIPTKMLETGAGIVLIGLGIKVLVEHTLA